MIERNGIVWCNFDTCWYLNDNGDWTEGCVEINMEYNEFYNGYLTETNGKHIKSLDYMEFFEELRKYKPDPEYDEVEKERLKKLGKL